MALAWWVATGSSSERGTDGRAPRCTTAPAPGSTASSTSGSTKSPTTSSHVDAVEVGGEPARQVVERDDLVDARRTSSCRHRFAPMNPAPPVTTTFMPTVYQARVGRRSAQGEVADEGTGEPAASPCVDVTVTKSLSVVVVKETCWSAVGPVPVVSVKLTVVKLLPEMVRTALAADWFFQSNSKVCGAAQPMAN